MVTEFEFNNDHRPEPIFEHVPPGLLKVDDRYQRSLMESRIRAWAKKGINEIAMQPFTVSMRPSGDRYVIDGQHRLAFAIRSNLATVPCWTHFGLTLADEARGFDVANQHQKNANALERFKARLEYGEPVALAIRDAVKSAGFRIAEDGRNPNVVRAVESLEKIYRLDGATGIVDTLNFIESVWGKLDEKSAQRKILLASFYFLRLYRKKNGSLDDVSGRLRGVDATEILRLSRTVQRVESTSSDVDAIYRVLIDISNRKRHASKRLSYVAMNAGENRPNNSISESTAITIRDRYDRGESITKIANDLDVSLSTARGIAERKKWLYLDQSDEKTS